MKILAINGGTKGSSWDLCYSILLYAKQEGHSVFVATPNNKPNNCLVAYYKIGNTFLRLLNRIITRIDGSDGFRNTFNTKKLIKYINSIKPDVVHLHTLHGYFVNIKALIVFLKKNNIHVVITCHDCWWFTGRCSHFYSNNCQKWKNDCLRCKYKREYPRTFLFDKANKYLLIKRNLFADYINLDIVCVSNWVACLCRDSLVFSNKKVKTIYNGIELEPFNGDIRNTFSDNIIVSVASNWTNSKGLDMIIELANQFSIYNFILVGRLKKKINLSNVKNVGYLSSKQELFSIYKKSTFLLNVSKQETFSLVNIEAQLCGLPVISFSKTGMKETIAPNSFPVEKYTTDDFARTIKKAQKTNINHFQIRKFAEKFSRERMCIEYINMYELAEKRGR